MTQFTDIKWCSSCENLAFMTAVRTICMEHYLLPTYNMSDLNVRLKSQHKQLDDEQQILTSEDLSNLFGFLEKHHVSTGLPLANRWTGSQISQLVLVFFSRKASFSYQHRWWNPSFELGAAVSCCSTLAATCSPSSSLWLSARMLWNWSDGETN